MFKTTSSLHSELLHGLQLDCCAYYPGLEYEIDDLFQNLVSLGLTEQGCEELSKIGKAIETSLITGDALDIPPNSIFNQCKVGTALPLHGYFLFSRVFHCATKHPLLSLTERAGIYRSYDREDPCTEAVFSDFLQKDDLQEFSLAIFLLRQLFLLHSKREDLAVIADENQEVEEFVSRVTRKRDIALSRQILTQARRFIADIFCDDEGRIAAALTQWRENAYGKHGPGAVFDGSSGPAKWDFIPSTFVRQTYRELVDLPPEALSEPLMSALSVVPKDFRKHRLICIESKEAMFYQQGLRMIIEHLMCTNPLASRIIHLKDQEWNYQKSKDLRYATIDLSDASDTVSRRLVKLLFPKEVYKMLVLGRSPLILLPDGSIIEYESMYTMGNALCFPIESLVFAALAVAVISVTSGASIQKASTRLRVFGDDIVVDRRYYKEVLDALQMAGCTPNNFKCCNNTLIRESCGSWFVHGLDCRVVRPATMQVVCAMDWVTWFQVAKNLTAMGLFNTATKVLSVLNNFWPVPYGYYGLPGDKKVIWQAQKTVGREYKIVRYNVQLQRAEYRIPTQDGGSTIHLKGKEALYAYFTGQAVTFSRHSYDTVSWVWTDLE